MTDESSTLRPLTLCFQHSPPNGTPCKKSISVELLEWHAREMEGCACVCEGGCVEGYADEYDGGCVGGCAGVVWVCGGGFASVTGKEICKQHAS